MGGLPQAQEIIFEVQSKMNNEKITRKKKNFPTYKTHSFFLFFFSLDLPSLLTFSFHIHFK
jgi:hypothetical protein